MKFRQLDLLRCSCGKSNMDVKNGTIRQVNFGFAIDKVRCERFCGLKRVTVADGKVNSADCAECYKQEITEGNIVCECGQKYPVIRGVPRFLPEKLAGNFEKVQKTFSYEWKMFRFGERNWGQDIEFRKEQFLKGMGVTPDDLKGKLMFDAGCGSGVLSIEMAKSFGMEVIALDLAFGIEKAYDHNDSPFVHFLQGSVLDPPFRKDSFDYIYCAGVLVALPDTQTGFLSIIKSLRKGGRCFIWVYHLLDKAHYPKERIKMLTYDSIRKYCTSRLPIAAQYYLYLSMMSIFLIKREIEVLAGITKDRRTWREKMQNMFDMFSPIYFNRHLSSEVCDWYRKAGFENVSVAYSEKHGFGVRGELRKQGSFLV